MSAMLATGPVATFSNTGEFVIVIGRLCVDHAKSSLKVNDLHRDIALKQVRSSFEKCCNSLKGINLSLQDLEFIVRDLEWVCAIFENGEFVDSLQKAVIPELRLRLEETALGERRRK